MSESTKPCPYKFHDERMTAGLRCGMCGSIPSTTQLTYEQPWGEGVPPETTIIEIPSTPDLGKSCDMHRWGEPRLDCNKCQVADKPTEPTCPTCEGTGDIQTGGIDGANPDYLLCPDCGGTGRVSHDI